MQAARGSGRFFLPSGQIKWIDMQGTRINYICRTVPVGKGKITIRTTKRTQHKDKCFV